MSHFLKLMCATVISICVLASARAETVIIKGSNTFGEELAPRLTEKYREANRGVTFELESKGTGTGFAALLAGECDIAAASRLANEDEQRLARSRGIKMNSYVIGYYGVAVIVNADNPLKNLSDEQVRDIFTGATLRWEAVGGAASPIQTYIRNPVSGAYLGFQELAMDRKQYAATAKTFVSDAEILKAVAADAAGIGYVGMHLDLPAAVRIVSVNGVQPSVLTVNELQYPYARQLRLYTDNRREPAAVRRFIRFVQSRRGQETLSELGFVRRFESRVGTPVSPWF